jgi:isoquinoline 1-oxidoreductase alpha subunit
MARMIVNGEPVLYRLDPEMPLLWALRDASNLTGTKYGCDSKDCGACTVMIDGQAVLSCAVTLGQLEGSKVTTIEGLGSGASHPVQQAWLAELATQCGFCEPGFIMAIAAMLDSGKTSAADIAGLPNICRCGSYPAIVRAAERAILSNNATVAQPEHERKDPARFTAG